MAKYATVDTLYECVGCETEVARHHIDTPKGLRCPKCDHFAFWYADICQRNEMPLIRSHAGMFAVRFTGHGKVYLPKIVIEEIKWIPSSEQPCPACREHEWHMIHEYNIYDAAHRFGLIASEGNGWEMYGTDIVNEGSSVYFPFQSNFRIWIDDIPLNYAELWNEDILTWEYFL